VGGRREQKRVCEKGMCGGKSQWGKKGKGYRQPITQLGFLK